MSKIDHLQYSIIKSLRKCLILLVIAITMIPSVVTFASEPTKSISIAYPRDSVPFYFSDETGQPAGIIIDLWRLWSEKTGIKIDFKVADWSETLAMVGSGKADVHAGLFFNSERDKFLDFGAALTKTDAHYFTHVALPLIKNIGDLKAYRVGVLDGDNVEKYLKERLSEGNVISFPDNSAIMNALQEGTLRVFAADTPTALFYLDKNGLRSQFNYISDKPLYQNDFFFAVKEGNQALIEVITQGMSLITDDEKRDINRRWISSIEKENENVLIIAINRAYAPLSFINALGRPSGLFVDIWRAWADATGRDIQFRATGWNETLEGLRAGEADIHVGLSYSKDLEGWIDFSHQIYVTYSRIYHRINEELPSDINLYGDRVIGVWFNTFQEKKLREENPKANIRSYGSTEELINDLLKGDIDAIVLEEQLMDTELDRLGVRAEIGTRPEKLFQSTIHAGVLNGNPELLQQINKGFTTLPREHLADLETRWIPNHENHFYKTGSRSIILSSDEKAWLSEHPVLRISNETDYPPFDYSVSGKASGLSIDVMNLISQKLGVSIQYVTGPPWNEFLNMLKNGELDAIHTIYDSEDRRKQFNLTENYYFRNVIGIFTLKHNNSVRNLADLEGKTVAYPRGYTLADTLRSEVPDIKIVNVETLTDALKALSAGEVDALVESSGAMRYLADQSNIGNIKIAGFADFKKQKDSDYTFKIAANKDNTQLISILDKAIESISDEELMEIEGKWVGALSHEKPEDTARIKLSNKEDTWLAQHKEIRLGIDPSWAPFEFVDKDGIYSGISSSYVEAAENRLQVDMQPMQGFTWSQVIEKVQSKDLDVLPAVVRSKSREKYLNFTKPYASFPVIIAVHRDLPYFSGLEDLSGYRIGVVKDYYADESIEKDYPNLKLTRFSTLKEGLTALDTGKLDAFVDTLDAITYEMTLSGFSNIKISAPTEYKCELAFGVRKDWPELTGLLNKVITDISEKERTLIKNTWMAPVELKYGIGLKKILIWAVPIGAGVVMIILFVFIWNRRLSVEVSERKKKEELIILGAKISQSLTLSDTLRETLQNITDIFVEELNVVFARIWVVDETDKVLKLLASSGLYDHTEGDHEHMPLEGDTKISRVVFEQKPHISNNIMESPYIKDKDWAREQGLKSFVGIPMIVDNHSVGAMVVFSREIITEDAYRTILSTSDSIAVAIERKRAEQEALASESKIRAMSESSLDALIMIDGKAGIIFWNPAAERIFGYSAEEAMGKNLHDLIVSPEVRELAHKGIADFTKTGEGNVIGVVIEHEALRKDGSIFPAEIAVSALQMENEWYAVGTVRDITNRKAAEEDLFRKEQRLRSYFTISQVGVAICHPENGWIEVNERALKMFGYTFDELKKLTWMELTHPEDLEADTLQYNQMLAGDIDYYTMDKRFLRKDGNTLYTNLAISCVRNNKNEVEMVLASYIDITERKQAEEELKEHMDELEQFNRLTINREEKMIQLKEEINSLLDQMGKESKYKIV